MAIRIGVVLFFLNRVFVLGHSEIKAEFKEIHK